MVSRVYVEKQPGFDVRAQALTTEAQELLGIQHLKAIRLINRYDVEGIDDALFMRAVDTIFSEPQIDRVSFTLVAALDEKVETARAVANPSSIPRTTTHDTREDLVVHAGATVFAVELLAGQFDQRAESARECIQLMSQGERPLLKSAEVYVLVADDGTELSSEDIAVFKHYVINPVESREATLELPTTLVAKIADPQKIQSLSGFINKDKAELTQLLGELGLAMDLADLTFCQTYFASEQRDPTITEIRMIDTYWSDHCRHTTFGTEICAVQIDEPRIAKTFETYLDLRHQLEREEKPVCLMDVATIGARELAKRGLLDQLDASEEINACTVKAKVDVDGSLEDWLYLFKNETHNHPTEIEPFGGAATCIGGAIRDPLSGRSYVYQAMRVTGAADPRVPLAETLEGKLPQRKLVTTAAEGYSSYGNQIGLATGQVKELYHPGYVAKRLEIGAVVGATPQSHVRRETPAPGDVIVLLGGRTGRDGIGGATGSSKKHVTESLTKDGAEVQKGNALTERKLQRLFRRADACRLIKRCNDFGAGGISVAIGELADGLDIQLDAVPKKYEGLDGTELAISESQERMAVALSPSDVDEFLGYAQEENLEATPVATVTDTNRLVMHWQGEQIVNISRDFLNSNGAPKQTSARIAPSTSYTPPYLLERHNKKLPTHDSASSRLAEQFSALVADLNVCSQKGLTERFDATIGAATVLMPFGGKAQLTPAQAMVAKLPVDGETTTCSGMAFGFNPFLSAADQFGGAYVAVLESVAKMVATGFSRKALYLTFQEYFEKLGENPMRWGKPLASLLGALQAQLDFKIASIGGKDSMSGSFNELDVPPTLVSFATGLGHVDHVRSPEFKAPNHRILALVPCYQEEGIRPVPASFLAICDVVERLNRTQKLAAISSVGYGSFAEALVSMCLGNQLGVQITAPADTFQTLRARTNNALRGSAPLEIEPENAFENALKTPLENALFMPAYGSFVLELSDDATHDVYETLRQDAQKHGYHACVLGTTTEVYQLEFTAATGVATKLDIAELQATWEDALAEVFPYKQAGDELAVIQQTEETHSTAAATTISTAAPEIHTGDAGKPRVIIPVFPGNNCEYDSARAFRRAGAAPDVFVVNNLTPTAISESVEELARRIKRSQIVMIPGGFSGGDEPDGSAKFITAFFRSPRITEAINQHLHDHDGLMLGICNGFQALIKLGLVPFGEIRNMDANCPTLTFNTIGRHQSRLVQTRVCSTQSPWFSQMRVGDIHSLAISHGEGRFIASEPLLQSLIANGQVATQYVNANGIPSLDWDINPNGSVAAIEAITSPDGRILGKMAHSERMANQLYKNVPGNHYQPLLEGGVAYFA